MTQFYVTAILQDSQGRRSRKLYLTQDIAAADLGAEFLLADTAAQALMLDLATLTEVEVLGYNVRYDATYADAATAGSNIDEGATFTITKEGSIHRATLKVPAPIQAVRRSDGTIDITLAAVTDYFANFVAAGDFTVSDGEIAEVMLSGKLDK